MHKKSLVIGHRGACGYAPENTLASFTKALELNVDMIELDVHQCASRELVVIHDSTVDRTTNGTGAVVQKTYEQLSQLNAGDGQKIPTLPEVLDLVDRKAAIDIEIKDVHATDAVGALLTQYVETQGWHWSDFLVTSFDFDVLLYLKNKFPHIQRAPVLETYSHTSDASIKEIGGTIVVIEYTQVNRGVIDDFHRKNISVFVFTVNNATIAQRFRQIGVGGIISDYPNRIA